MRIRTPLVLTPLFALVLVFAGCGVDSDNPPPVAPASSTFHANFYFSPSGYVQPFPTDLFFLGSQDGTVNIQGLPAPHDFSKPLVAINTLDGFSTTAPMSEKFSQPIDPSSLAGNVFVFSVQTDPAHGFAVTGVNGLLVAGSDYTMAVSSVDPSVLKITPSGALDSSSSYMIVLTSGIKSAEGAPVQPSRQFKKIKQALAGGGSLDSPLLRKIAPLFGAMLQAAHAAAGIKPADVALIWTVSTQSVGPVLATIAANATPGTLKFQDLGKTTKDINPALKGFAEVFVGTLTLPYYSGIPTPEHPAAPLTAFWHGAHGSLLTRYNPDPVPTGTLEIPVIMTIPAQGSPYFMQGGVYPPNGWPVVIFQHGITGNRLHALAVADTLAQFGMAMVAIDLPLHGITDPSNPFFRNQLMQGVKEDLVVPTERTFGLPKGLGTGSPKAGTIADSGAYFINLSYLLTSRDNLREAVADLLHLTVTLPAARFGTRVGGTPKIEKFNTLRTYFAGLSLGAMVGIPYLATVTDLPGYGSRIAVQSATLSEPGGKVAYLLKTSPTFGPVVQNGLAQQGINPGTTLYALFFKWAQTVIDSGDPLNYAPEAAENAPIDMTMVVGDGSHPPDQVVPVWTQKLLAEAMDLEQIGRTTVDPDGIRGVVKFTRGRHASLINPEFAPLVTKQMQIEMAVFAAGCPPTLAFCPQPRGGPPNGKTMAIAVPSVVQQPD